MLFFYAFYFISAPFYFQYEKELMRYYNNFTKRPQYLFPVIFSAIVKYKPVTMTNCKYYASLANQKALHKCYCCLFRC